jgi:hypothetical protein
MHRQHKALVRLTKQHYKTHLSQGSLLVVLIVMVTCA